MRVLAGMGLGALSGVLVLLSAPQHGFGWLILVAGVPMLVAQHRVLPAASAGLATCVTYIIVAYGWARLIRDVDPQHTALTGFAIAAIGLGAGLVGQVERGLWGRIGYRWWIVAGPLAWGLQAMVRLRLPFAGSDAFLALGLFRHPAVLQPVGVVGIVGLEMAIVAVNVVLAALAMSLLGDERFPRPGARRLGLGLAAGVVAWVGWSLVLLDDPPPTVRVAAVQPAVASWFSYSPGTDGDGDDPAFEAMAEMTDEAAAAGAEVVVWPEYGLLYDPCDPAGPEGSMVLPGGLDGPGPVADDADADTDTQAGTGELAVAELARSADVHLVVGHGAFDGFDETGMPNEEPFRARNEAVLVTPEGECLGPYAKQHPVRWLGEEADTDHGAPTFATDLGRLAMVIGYDLDFTDVTRAMAGDGARLIAAPSDDAAATARYHLAPLVFRSVENGVATVKADQRHDSAVVDPHGRIVDEVVDPDPGGRPAVVVADVPLGSGRRTFWNRHAGHLELLWSAAALVVAALVLRDLRRSTRLRQEPS